MRKIFFAEGRKITRTVGFSASRTPFLESTKIAGDIKLFKILGAAVSVICKYIQIIK